ncbi:MAG TPA: ABC transporter permease subunit [Candidatus Polarisedimenticolia bacterium]|nr:ABC transporter permease subunit [Candidatus Polarisedimenticolia bacterium]
MTAIALPSLRARLGRLGGSVRGASSGLTAIGVKELRGRMRGRRAFIILTVYLILIGGFAWMSEILQEKLYAGAFANQATFASAAIGRAVFGAILLLETLLVVVLTPGFTAGAISLEREKQTLDMLATTPISSLAIVIGKLLSALVYVFILVLASVPLSALVFVFGGVAWDDVLRGYIVLLATAVGIGSVALFFSALARRTQAATILSYFAVLAATLGSLFIFSFWSTVASTTTFAPDGSTRISGGPPEAIMYLNPYIAQADVLCGAGDGVDALDRNTTFCGRVGSITGANPFGITTPLPMPGVKVDPGFGGVINLGGGDGVNVDGAPGCPANARCAAIAFDDVAVTEGQIFGVQRDTFWPKSVAAWLVISVIFTLLSVQLVTPTRRWRPRLPGFLRRRSSRSPA